MLLNLSNPLYNTIIVFIVVMALLYIAKPVIIYDNKEKKFRQFGMDEEKTLLPIYVMGILLAISIYVLFYHLSNKKDMSSEINQAYSNMINAHHRV